MNRGQGENVIEFIYEMDKQSFEQNYVLPNLRKLVKKISPVMKTESDGFTIAKTFMSSINIYEDNGGFAGFEPRSGAGTQFLFNIMRIYSDVNFIGALINFQSNSLEYWDLPLDLCKSSKSYFGLVTNSRNRQIAQLKFTPSAEKWFVHSGIQPRMVDFWHNLCGLEKKLSSQYSKRPSDSKGRFSAFARN